VDAGPTISRTRLAVEILAIVAIGIPLLAYLWETLNHLLAGVVSPARLAMTVPFAIAFVLLVRLMHRATGRWEIQRETTVARSRRHDGE